MMRCFHPRAGFPCGKCPACLLNRQRQFAFRLEEERKGSDFYIWLTLTYADEYLPLSPVNKQPCVSKSDCRTFFEALRKKYPQVKVKHFLVSEYGPKTYRPHYHALLFATTDNKDTKYLYNLKKQMSDWIEQKGWKRGFTYIKNAHVNVYSYVTKYCCKPELIGFHPEVPPFTLISPGIGISFLERQEADKMIITDNYSTLYRGKKMELPRYFKQKIRPSNLGSLANPIPEDQFNEHYANNRYWKQYNKRFSAKGAAALDAERENHPIARPNEVDWYRWTDSKKAQQEYSFNERLKNRQDG